VTLSTLKTSKDECCSLRASCVILSHAEPDDLYLWLISQMFVLKGEHRVLDTQVYWPRILAPFPEKPGS